MIRVLDGSHGDMQIEIEYKIYLAHEVHEDISCEAISDQFTEVGHYCSWCAHIYHRQYYCKQIIVVDHPFSEHLIDKIKELWHDYVVGESPINRVHILKTHSIFQPNPYDSCRLQW